MNRKRVQINFIPAPHSVIPPDRFDAVVSHLEKLREDADGSLTPRNVLEAARPARAPLHDFFDWNDATAAESWRLNEARVLIRSVKIQVTEVSTTDPSVKTISVVPAYVSLSPSGEDEPEAGDPPRAYARLDLALTVPDHRRQILSEAFASLYDLRRRYALLQELSKIFSTVDDVASELGMEKTAS